MASREIFCCNAIAIVILKLEINCLDNISVYILCLNLINWLITTLYSSSNIIKWLRKKRWIKISSYGA